MDRDILRSITSLALTAVLLAAGTIFLSLAIDRTIGHRPTWPAVGDDASDKPSSRQLMPAGGTFSDTIDQAPVDSNLRKLWQALHEEENTRLKFPIEVEEAMLGQQDQGV